MSAIDDRLGPRFSTLTSTSGLSQDRISMEPSNVESSMSGFPVVENRRFSRSTYLPTSDPEMATQPDAAVSSPSMTAERRTMGKAPQAWTEPGGAEFEMSSRDNT